MLSNTSVYIRTDFKESISLTSGANMRCVSSLPYCFFELFAFIMSFTLFFISLDVDETKSKIG